jgi:hypothetical protein
MDLTQFMRAGRSGAGRNGSAAVAEGAQAAGGATTAAPAQSGASGTTRPGAGGSQDPAAAARGGAPANDPQAAARRARVDSLRAQVERGEITQDSMRVIMQAMRARGEAGPGGGPGEGIPGAAERPAPSAQPAAAGAAPARETRPVVVFILGADSVPEPRLVQAGLNDWDNTQVVSGLEGTETLVVVSAAQLQAQQQQWLNQIRDRMGSGMFGGGGPGMGGGPPSGGGGRPGGGGGRPPGGD